MNQHSALDHYAVPFQENGKTPQWWCTAEACKCPHTSMGQSWKGETCFSPESWRKTRYHCVHRCTQWYLVPSCASSGPRWRGDIPHLKNESAILRVHRSRPLPLPVPMGTGPTGLQIHVIFCAWPNPMSTGLVVIVLNRVNKTEMQNYCTV